MLDIKTKLSPPWVLFKNEIQALFGQDPDIEIEHIDDDYNHVIKLLVKDNDKASALNELLPVSKTFGNVEVEIEVCPTNEKDVIASTFDWDRATLYKAAFHNNPVFAFVHVVEGIFASNFTYVVFKNRVVQFFNDNLQDVYGNISTLYQEIAKDVFYNEDRVFFCTDIEERVGKPIGEWP